MTRLRKALLAVTLAALLATGLLLGRSTPLQAQSDPWATAPFGIGLAVVVTSCGTQSLTIGTYSQATIGLGGTGC